MVFSWNPLPLTFDTQVSNSGKHIEQSFDQEQITLGNGLTSFCGQYSSMWFPFSLWQIQESLSWRKITPCFLSNFLVENFPWYGLG